MAGRVLDPTALLGAEVRCTLAALPRAAGIAPRLDRIGWLPGKRERIVRRFPAVTLSLVLAGRGEGVFNLCPA